MKRICFYVGSLTACWGLRSFCSSYRSRCWSSWGRSWRGRLGDCQYSAILVPIVVPEREHGQQQKSQHCSKRCKDISVQKSQLLCHPIVRFTTFQQESLCEVGHNLCGNMSLKVVFLQELGNNRYNKLFRMSGPICSMKCWPAWPQVWSCRGG